VKDAVVGIEALKSLDIALTDELNLTPGQQFVRVHARSRLRVSFLSVASHYPKRGPRAVSAPVPCTVNSLCHFNPTWHLSGGGSNYGRGMANRYQYTVVELREGMIGGKMSGDKLEKVLNDHAAQGWQLKAITSVEVRGRVGPGGVEGLLVTFERLVG
jgi:hypothetical protein